MCRGRMVVRGGGDVVVDVVPEGALEGHTGNPHPAFPCHGVARGGVGWDWAISGSR